MVWNVRVIARWLIVSQLLGGVAWAQDEAEKPKPQPTSIHAAAAAKKEPPMLKTKLSPALEKAGWFLIIVGGVAMVTTAGTTYDIFGHDVCVTEYSVTDGMCSKSALEMKVLSAAVATGVAFVVIGGHKVALRPEISSHHKSVSATIRW